MRRRKAWWICVPTFSGGWTTVRSISIAAQPCSGWPPTHGTADIVATPRARFENQLAPQILAQRLEQLRARCDGLIRIHSGCDFHFGYANIRDALANPRKYTINRLNHLLVEFADHSIPPGTEEALASFGKQGLVPIICHPERHPILQHSIERLKGWISRDCLVQVTARSLSGHFGNVEQRCAWNLLREGMVHIIASDARDMLHNPPRLDGAWRLVKRELGEDVAKRLLIDNPSVVIRGGTIGLKSAVPVALATKAAAG